jgi:hypothetical protein
MSAEKSILNEATSSELHSTTIGNNVSSSTTSYVWELGHSPAKPDRRSLLSIYLGALTVASELNLEGASRIGGILGLASDVAELIDCQVAIEVRAQINLMLVTLESPELFLFQTGAIRIDLEAEGLRREVLKFPIYQADLWIKENSAYLSHS